jgi:hypothetical protein
MDHPNEEEIEAYFKMKIKGARFCELDDHIQSCEECQDTLASVQQLSQDELEKS